MVTNKLNQRNNKPHTHNLVISCMSPFTEKGVSDGHTEQDEGEGHIPA